MVATLINPRWINIPEGDIFFSLVRLGLNTWHVKRVDVAGVARHYLWADVINYAYPYSLPVATIERLAERLNEVKYMTWYRDYNQQAITHFNAHGTAFNQAVQYWEHYGDPALPKPQVMPIDGLEDGSVYIAIIGLFHLTGSENGNNHHLYIDLIDEAGDRIYNHTPPLDLYWGWEGMLPSEVRDASPVRIDKPSNEAGANIGMTWDQVVYGFHVNNIPTDRFRNVHIRYGDDGPGNNQGHHSHYIVLQKRVWEGAGGPVDPPPIDPPDPTAKGSMQVVVDKVYFNSLPVDQQGRVKLIVPIYR